MFSGNQKISPRQLKRLLVLDFFGKGALLLPAFSKGVTAREFLLHLLLALGLLLLYGKALTCLSRYVRGDFFAYLKERLGSVTTFLAGVFFLSYALLNLVYFTKTFGTLGHTFVLPETGEPYLMVLLLLGAMYVALGGLEVRGRAAEVWYPVLFYPMLFLLAFCGWNARTAAASNPVSSGLGLQAKTIFQMFSVFGGTTGFLFLAPQVDGRKKGEKAFLKGMLLTAAALFGLFLVLAVTFGERGISEFTFPTVALMSSAKLPGGFLERWDVIFTALLMAGLFISAGASLYYGLLIGKTLFPGLNRRLTAAGFCLLAFLAAWQWGDYEGIVTVYTRVNSYVLVPVGVSMALLLLWLEKIKERERV